MQAALNERYPNHYVQGPWISYFSAGSHTLQYCQPDGLLIDSEQGLIVIIEIKLRHTSDAWWQLRHLYEPVVRKLFGDTQWRYGLVEIVRWFDPAVPFPEKFQKLKTISHIQPGRLGVHIWE